MAQGLETSVLTLVTEVDGSLKEVLSVDTAGSNAASGLPESETFRWQAALEVMPDTSAGFPDLRLKATGSKPVETGAESGRIRPFSSTTVYRFSGGTYKPAAK